nr:DoxX family protein [Propionivibrio sp.]
MNDRSNPEMRAGNARPKTVLKYAAWLKFSGVSVDFFNRVVRRLIWPKADLVIRLWLAEIFFVSGVLKLTAWHTALDLATNEYAVSWMNPVSAAYTGVGIEVLGGVLLAIGFMTRYAAIPMLILSLVIQFAYLPFDNQLFWALLFAWYAIQGAGPLSIDSLLRRGLADSALPLVPSIVRASDRVRVHLGPIILSAMRLWLASTLLLAVWPGFLDQNQLAAAGMWLPLQTVAYMPVSVALVGGVLLLMGFATRYVSIALILALFVGTMIDPRLNDAAYMLMLFVIFVVPWCGSDLGRSWCAAAVQEIPAATSSSLPVAGWIAARRDRRCRLWRSQLCRGAAPRQCIGHRDRSGQLSPVSTAALSGCHRRALAG